MGFPTLGPDAVCCTSATCKYSGTSQSHVQASGNPQNDAASSQISFSIKFPFKQERCINENIDKYIHISNPRLWPGLLEGM